ncbi:unnamed protein product [Adineta steineri]|uniref:TIR domain-containing protein n=1 Tax=Adineta steineri TaxID=433720 RepID=A0A818WXM6_9BILA|nr:unnamed protein product [Adineta steineri]
MENNFEKLIADFLLTPSSNNILNQIIVHLQQQTDELLPSFISQSFQSLLILEQWTWKLLGEESSEWIKQSDYLELLDTLTLFNLTLIFHNNDIDTDIKFSLLIPENTEIIDKIFNEIEKIEDHNDPFLRIISRWFDNLSYLVHEHAQFPISPIIIHLCQHIGHNYILNDQYKFYLTQLCQTQIPQSIFTTKQLFYIKTCSFLFRMYICSKLDKSPFKGYELLERYGNDYLKIILAHYHTVNSWSKELLTCITHLIDFICACCWWGEDNALYIQMLIPPEPIFYEYIQGLIQIIGEKTFHERITSQWCNDETILIDSTLIFFLGSLLQIKDLSCFIRSETILSNIILAIAQQSCYDRISLCAYGILAEILSDEQLKELKITHNISEFFFRILELAWHHPTQRCKRIPIPQLLRGFLTLSKNDAIQQKTADLNKISLFIDISDQYPIAFKIIWALSFNHDIQQQLRSSRIFMNKLTLLKEGCKNEKLRKIIFGILWNLEWKGLDRTISSEVNDGKTFDIMISYSHKDELICKQIYEELTKNGYRVWIDFDQIHGNVMDAMAQAIERSQTIIICMSEQYRRSNYCRAEAHYAFQRELKIVPILLQEHYQPDGWLLFLIGQLLYVDFTKYEFPRAMELLIQELKAPVIKETQLVTTQSKQDINSIVSLSHGLLIFPENIHEWTQMHVQNWLIGCNLRQMARLLYDFDGPSLHSLTELITNSNSQEILTLLQEDSLRRLNESISLLEFARLRTLLIEKQRLMEVKHEVKNNNSTFNIFHQCHMM